MKTTNVMYSLYIILMLFFLGCTAIGVIPAKIVYMYPTGELFEISAANGAVAKVDNGTLSLYLPMFDKNSTSPKRFQFQWDRENNNWKERFGGAIIEYISQDKEVQLTSGRKMILKPNMIFVKFNENPIYKELSGKSIWLTANVGPKEIKKIKGIYKESDINYIDAINQPGDFSDVLK